MTRNIAPNGASIGLMNGLLIRSRAENDRDQLAAVQGFIEERFPAVAETMKGAATSEIAIKIMEQMGSQLGAAKDRIEVLEKEAVDDDPNGGWK